MITVTIDGRTVEVEPGTLIVEAAKRVGIHIPTYCYHPKLDPAGLCRICLVEVEKMPKLQTACSTPVSEGMVVHTDTPAVAEARRGVMEFLLLNHPLDCPICDKGGECDLQNYSYRYGSPLSRLQDAKEHKRKAAILGPFIVLDEERCILCRRCVRFDTEVAREGTLTVFDRGTHSVIGTADGSPYVSYFSGNTIELCPVGALTSRLYRFRARPWDLERTPVVCHHCPVGCNLEAHTRQGRLERLVVRENPATDGGWLCDRGRFGYRYAQEGPRLRQPLLRRDGELVPVTWQEAAVEAVRRLGEARGRTAVLGGARLTNEEAYLLQKFARAVLATHDVDWRLAGEALAAPPRHLAARMTDVDRAGALVLAGVLPAEEAPVLDLRLRRAAARRGAAVLSVGPLRPTYEGLHRHLACPPAELAARLEALAAAVRGRPAPDWATEAVTSLARDPVVLLVTG
ncbi:MAG: (2Fe-2S)-binding protein, partial [Clostridia bacterium]|nr:(2Fe-2S)-binding protein [Clostridia bacterium]